MDSSAVAGIGLFFVILWGLAFVIAILWIIFPIIVWVKLNGVREDLDDLSKTLERLLDVTLHSNGLSAKLVELGVTQQAKPDLTLPAHKQYHVAVGVNDLGPKDLVTIRSMLATGELLPTNHYLEPTANEWRQLNTNPEFC